MKTPSILITGLVMLALLCSIGVTAAQEASTIDTTATIAPETVTTTSTDSQEMSVADDIPPYDGAIGADSPLYGLKIAMEDLDESFTTNQSERLNKQLRFQQLRIAEVRRELDLNRTATAQRALDLLAEAKQHRNDHYPPCRQHDRAPSCTGADCTAPVCLRKPCADTPG